MKYGDAPAVNFICTLIRPAHALHLIWVLCSARASRMPMGTHFPATFTSHSSIGPAFTVPDHLALDLA
jgi:hypothetical protein